VAAYSAADRYLTKAQLADRWHLSRRQIERKMSSGALVYVRQPGTRKALFSLAYIEALERQSTHTSTAAEAAKERAAALESSKGELKDDDT
jgi:hypothetical protein